MNNNLNETNRNLIRNLTKEITNDCIFVTEEIDTTLNNSQRIQQYQNFGQPMWHSFSIDGMTLSETYPSQTHTAAHLQSRNTSTTFTTQGLNYNSHSGSHLSKIPRQIVPYERIDPFSGLTSLSITDINAQTAPTTQTLHQHSIIAPYTMMINSKFDSKDSLQLSQEEQLEEITSIDTAPATATIDNESIVVIIDNQTSNSNTISNTTFSTTTNSSQLSHAANEQQYSMTTTTTSSSSASNNNFQQQLIMQQQHHHPFFSSLSSSSSSNNNNNNQNNNNHQNIQLMESPGLTTTFEKSAFEQDGKNTNNSFSNVPSNFHSYNNNNTITTTTNNTQQLLMSAQQSNSMNGCFVGGSLSSSSSSTSQPTQNHITNIAIGGATNNTNNIHNNSAAAAASAIATTTTNNNSNATATTMVNCLGNHPHHQHQQQFNIGSANNNNMVNMHHQTFNYHSMVNNGGNVVSANMIDDGQFGSTSLKACLEDSSSLDINNSLNSFSNLIMNSNNSNNNQTIINTHQHCLDEALEGIEFQIMDLANEGFPNQFLTSTNNNSVNDHGDMDSSNSIHQHAMIPSHMPSHELIDHMLLNHNSITNNTIIEKTNKKESNSPNQNDQETSSNAKNTYAPLTFTVEQLRPHFETPIKNVAAMLNISLTQLKRVCRTVGIPRWPYRKIQSLKSKINEKNILLEKLLKQSKVIIDPLKRQNVENRIVTMKNDIANVEKQIQQIKLDPKSAVSGNFDNNSDTMQESEGSENNSTITFHNQIITNSHLKNGSGAIMGQMRSVVHVGKAPRRNSVKANSNTPTTTVVPNNVNQQDNTSNGKRKTRTVEHVALNNNNMYPQQQQQLDIKNVQQPNMYNNQYGNTLPNNSTTMGNMNYNFVQNNNSVEVDRKKRKMNDISPPPQTVQMPSYPNNSFANSPAQNFTSYNVPQSSTTNQPQQQFYFHNNNNYVNNGDTYTNLLAMINRGVIPNNSSTYYPNQQVSNNMNNVVPQNNYLQNYYSNIGNNAPFQQNNTFIPNSSLSTTDNNNPTDTLDISKALISQSEIYSNLGKFQ